LSRGLLRRCQDLTQVFAADVVDSDDDEVDMPPLNDVGQILPSTQHGEPVNSLPALPRIVINEANQVVDLPRLVSQEPECQMLARVTGSIDDRARPFADIPAGGGQPPQEARAVAD
jgi:hypothetical protein